jgi:hypothetical protein
MPSNRSVSSMHASGMRMRSRCVHRAIAKEFSWGMDCYPWLLSLLGCLSVSAVSYPAPCGLSAGRPAYSTEIE